MKTMFFAAAAALLACIFFVACTLHSHTRVENDTIAIKDPSPVEADIIKAHIGDDDVPASTNSSAKADQD